MKTYNLTRLNQKQITKLCRRPALRSDRVFEVVKKVLIDVRQDGDAAVRQYSQKFNDLLLNNFAVSQREIKRACASLPPKIKNALKQAAKNIEKFHKKQLGRKGRVETVKGVVCWQEMRAIEKVGLYIPGGTAPLPSTVLMLGVPAKIAGCEEVVLCTPPQKDGNAPDAVLYAAQLCGIKKIFKIGGAQAIAAMAYGTKSVPKAYKVFGPGNQYVTAAKMLVSIDPKGCAIDLPAGPSELLVIADKYAKGDFVSADLLSQAEHGPDSQVILACTTQKLAKIVPREIKKQLAALPRKQIAAKALQNSFVIVAQNIKRAIEFANQYAPEHLILNVKNAGEHVKYIQNAGSVFLGQYSCESAGDYASGTNHTLPTYGYARAYSGVTVDSFMKSVSFQQITRKGLQNLSSTIIKIAESEKLEAHKNAVEIRCN